MAQGEEEGLHVEGQRLVPSTHIRWPIPMSYFSSRESNSFGVCRCTQVHIHTHMHMVTNKIFKKTEQLRLLYEHEAQL